MSEYLLGGVDCGATHTRVVIFDEEMRAVAGIRQFSTNIGNYEGHVQAIGDTMLDMARQYGQGELVAASAAVAAAVDAEGSLIVSGALRPWLGRKFGVDVGIAASLGEGLAGSLNDMYAAALSQQSINKENRRSSNGIVMTLSSGWGGAKYPADGECENIEPGHAHLRNGATCSCGTEGHAEAFISGNGVLLNHRKRMEHWLREPAAGDQLVADLSTAVIQLVQRHEASGPKELRWTGSVALGQPFIMRRAAQKMRRQLGPHAPAWEKVTMGAEAGLHGTFIDALQRAQAA